MADEPIYTTNKFGVATKSSGSLVILMPPRELTKADALLLAAWLVAMAEDEPGEFERVRAAVEGC